ncbi:hypothetical protein ACFL6U_03805 [Planctomycetota bacterium]
MELIEIEEEVVFLKAITEAIASMVNYEMLTLDGDATDKTIRFNTSTHQKFFNIVLVDFLSRTDQKAPVKRKSYLGALREISEKPCFSVRDSVTLLRNATDSFVEWLDQIIEVDIWLPSIDRETVIQITRLSFLKMCGDISKHNILRSIGVAKELQETLEASKVVVDLEEAMLALADFYEKFHADLLNYHSSTIIEFLNNIQWGIYDYLLPEFRRSIVHEGGNPPMYRFTYPKDITNTFAKQCYWDLLNEVRAKPYIPRFGVTKWLKLRY